MKDLASSAPSPGKPDRGVKNEPGRVGARKARKSKSNLDPDLKGIRLSGAGHLNILSTACHVGLASSVRSEGKLRLWGMVPWAAAPTTRPLSGGCHPTEYQRARQPASIQSRKERGDTGLWKW